MKNRNGNLDTLDGILEKIWNMLEQGAIHSDDPFHWPVLGTGAAEGCTLRTVILRQVKMADRILVCHTDARSAKVQQIMNGSQTSWLLLKITGNRRALFEWDDDGLQSTWLVP
ncbi:MAG: hypothetical protein P8185_04110 [Deltaproteobacteria bacterium]